MALGLSPLKTVPAAGAEASGDCGDIGARCRMRHKSVCRPARFLLAQILDGPPLERAASPDELL